MRLRLVEACQGLVLFLLILALYVGGTVLFGGGAP